jgi:hypothetical protein
VSLVFEHLDEVLVRVLRTRDELLADGAAPNRAARLAAVFESEARVWSQLYELSGIRLVWRAALAAEAGARANAEWWAERTGAETWRLPASEWPARAVGKADGPSRPPVAATGGRRGR